VQIPDSPQTAKILRTGGKNHQGGVEEDRKTLGMEEARFPGEREMR